MRSDEKNEHEHELYVGFLKTKKNTKDVERVFPEQ